MRRVFAIEKFRVLLLAGTFSVLTGFFVCLTDSVIAGNMLGEGALAGVGLISPIIAFVAFLSGLVATGVGTLYSTELGRCDLNRARCYFTQGMWTVLIVGGAATLGFFLFRNVIVGYYGAGAEVSANALGYLSGIAPHGVVQGLFLLLSILCYADGDAKLSFVGSAVALIGNVLLSILFVNCGWRTFGLAIATVIAEFLGMLVLAGHFLRKTNSYAFSRHFSVKDSFRIVSAAFGDAASYLCDALLALFLNKWVLANPLFGQDWLPVLGVINSLWGLRVVFDGIGVALQPVVSVYYGEGNHRCVRTVMHSAMQWSMVEGMAIAIAFVTFPSAVVAFFGISEPTCAANAVVAVRVFAGTFVALAFTGLFNSYYMFIDRPVLAGSLTFLAYLVLPVCCAASFSCVSQLGFWAGLAAGPYCGLFISMVIVACASGRKGLPLCLDRNREEKIRVFNLLLEDDQIVDVSRQIGATPGVPMKAALLAEEAFEVVKDRNPGRKILGEATLDLNDGVRLTLRDDGEIFDITDADQRISSLRSFLVASMMACHDGRMNLVTTGFNRNVFRF